jgi:sulfofructose kinase
VKPIISIGSAVWDTIFNVDVIPQRGIKVLSKSAKQIASGMAATAAACMARLGAPVKLWCMVGNDMTGEILLRELEAEGVNTAEAIRVNGASTAFSSILIDANGERLAVPFFDPLLTAPSTSLPLHTIQEASVVLSDVRWPDATQAAFKAASQYGVASVLDADIASPEILWRLAPLADHVLFSELALASLIGQHSPEQSLALIRAKLPNAKVIGVTLGDKGAAIVQGDVFSLYPGIPIQCVDTLGAGDVWHGTYCYGLAKGLEISERVMLANIAAAMKCEQPWGRLGSPRIEALMKRRDSLLL